VGAADAGGTAQTLIEHWDGTAWTRVRSPSGGTISGLRAVAVTSASDAWAVGLTLSPRAGVRGLIEHWNGKAWARVPSPGEGGLAGVAAAGPRTAWAVGFDADSTVTEYWNGTAWK
jgi:hypothetical protein